MKRSFVLSVMFMLLSLAALAADTGGVNDRLQRWAGKKIFTDREPVSATLSGNVTLDKNSTQVRFYDANGSHRDITLSPLADSVGYEFIIRNTTAATYNLVVKNVAAATIATVGPLETGYFYCDGVTWVGYVLSEAAGGYMVASGATVGATSQSQVFTNGVTTDAVTGNTATPLAIAAKAGSSAVGNAITLTGGAGNGAFDGGAASLLGGASGVGATGNGGAVALTAAASTATNGDGGAATVTAGAGVGSGSGGANTQVAGAGGATGAGGAFNITAGRGGSTSGAAGVLTATAGAGGAATTTTGGIAQLIGGGSGTGATGNGGISKIVGGAALSTNGSGGAAQVTGGVATGTGTGGNVTLTAGASAGAGGTAGSVTIDAGDEATGTAGTITIGGTEAGAMTIGRTGQTVTFPGTASFTVSPAGDGVTRYKEVSITNAQMLDLADTPVELIAAPGAGKVIEVESVVFLFDYTAAYTAGGGDDLDICYGAETAIIATGEATGFVDATADDMLFVTRVANFSPSKTVAENVAVVLANDGTDFGGGDAANAVRVKIAYRTWATGF